MVFNIKSPNKNQKGFLFLRNDEAVLISKLGDKIIAKIKDNFHVLAMYSSYSYNQKPLELVDIYLAPYSGVKWIIQPKHVLDIATRNFMENEDFEYNEVKTIYDFAYISNLAVLKKNIEWVQNLQALINIRPDISSINIIPIPDGEFLLFKRLKLILSRFPIKFSERHLFLFLKRHPLACLYPLPYNMVRNFLRQSKIFVHTSFIEGECRVITEALAAGCFIVANKELLGAGLDFLNEENSLLFRSYDDLLPTLQKALMIQNSRLKNNIQFKNKLLKSNSIKFILDYMQQNNFDFDKEYIFSKLSNIDLKYALAGHSYTIDSKIKGKWYLGTLLNLFSCINYLENDLKIKVNKKITILILEFIKNKPKLILKNFYYILRKQSSQFYRLVREFFLIK